MAVTTVICVPGPWKDRTAVVQSIAGDSGGWLLAGAVMMHAETKAAYTLEVQGHDARMRRAFEVAGFGGELDVIEAHTQVLYAIAEGGTREAAKGFLRAGAGLLRAGGLGVKVESTGRAHTPEAWMELADDADDGALFEAFVTFVSAGKRTLHTCGMHNLGLPDARVDAPLAPAESINLLRAFHFFQIVDRPVLKSGETFRVGADAPRYRLAMTPCDAYPEDDLFHNPNGVWRLTPA
jgi:hypothetical protein